MAIRATTLANEMLEAVCNDLHIKPTFAHTNLHARVLNKQANAQYMGEQTNAEASLIFETGTELLIKLSNNPEWIQYAKENGFYIEPYSSWKLDIFKL